MAHRFPYRLEPQASGGVLVQFIDVPEAHTFGATEAEAGGNALDCLIAALGGYIRLGRAISRPSPARGRPVVILPPLVSAKLALYEALRAQRITRTELARPLGLQENGIRRPLDLDHHSHIRSTARWPRSASGSRCASWSRRNRKAGLHQYAVPLSRIRTLMRCQWTRSRAICSGALL